MLERHAGQAAHILGQRAVGRRQAVADFALLIKRSEFFVGQKPVRQAGRVGKQVVDGDFPRGRHCVRPIADRATAFL